MHALSASRRSRVRAVPRRLAIYVIDESEKVACTRIESHYRERLTSQELRAMLEAIKQRDEARAAALEP